MHAKRRGFGCEHHLRRLPFQIEIENTNAHITDRGMAAKMRYLFQSLHAEAEHFRRHDNRVERVNGDAQAVFVKHAAIKVDLRMPANLIGVEFEMLNRRAVHNHFMERAMPHNHGSVGAGFIKFFARHMAVPIAVIAPSEEGGVFARIGQFFQPRQICVMGFGGRHFFPRQIPFQRGDELHRQNHRRH